MSENLREMVAGQIDWNGFEGCTNYEDCLLVAKEWVAANERDEVEMPFTAEEIAKEAFNQLFVGNGETLISIVDFLKTTTLRVYKNSIQDEYDSDGNEIVHIFNSENFKESNVCESYDNYGQQIGCENAGCCSIDNSYYFKTKLDEDDFETREDFAAAVKAEFEETYETNHSTWLAYDYFNGHNWNTLVLKGSETNHGNNEGLVELDEELQAKILMQFEDKEFVGEGFGSRTYKSENYMFVESASASDPYIADVTIID